MCGPDEKTGSLFSYVNLEERIPARHPLRKIKGVVDAVLVSLDDEFALLYADKGRPSIAPERLLRASLVQILFSIRSERQLMGAAALQPAVPLIRGAVDRRAGVGADRVHEEPRPAARASPGSTKRITLGADKGYDDRGFVAKQRQMCGTPHVAAKSKHSAIDARTTRHAGHATSQRKRKRVEEPFGWGKTVGPIAKTMLRGLDRVGTQFTLTMAAYNLARLPRLLPA